MLLTYLITQVELYFPHLSHYIYVISGSSFDFIDLILFSRKTGIDRYSRGNDKPPTEAGAWNTAKFVSFGRCIHLLTKDRKQLSIVFNEDRVIMVDVFAVVVLIEL